MEAQLVEVLHGTWFALPGDCRLSKTRKGTRPGDNLADLLFSFVFARLLKRAMDVLQDDGITFTVTGCCEPHPFPWQLDVQATATFQLLGPTWADDLAVMVDADTPAELLQRTRRIGSEIFDQFAISGMDVNFGHSKTEIVMTLRGCNAPAIRRELFRHTPACLDIDTRLLGTVHVRLVQTYRHLGTLFATGGRMAPEIRQRLGHAKSEFRRHRKAIYGLGKLTCQRRVQLFKTMVMTGLMYNIAVWPPLTKQEHTQFANGLLSLYSSLAYAIFGPEAFTWRDERILSRLGLPSPNEVFHMARLRYLQHIILQGDCVIWTVLQLESSWLSLVDQDLAWLRGQVPWRVPQMDPRDSWDPWSVLIQTHSQWKNLVNKAGVHAQLQRKRQSDWYDWRRRFLDMLAANQLWQDNRSTDMNGIHACLKCRKRFSTKAAWSVHAFKIHSRITPARKFADGVECKVCMKRYGSHDRLVNHLKYSAKCHREHRRRQLFVAPQPSVNSAAIRRQQHGGVLPILHVYGPQNEPAETEPYDWTDGLGPAEHACIDELVDLYEQLSQQPMTTEDAITVVHTIFNRSWTYAPRLINLFCISMDDYIRLELATGTCEDDVFIVALKELREGVCAVWSADWLLSDIVDTRSSTKTGHGTLDPEIELGKLCPSTTLRRPHRPLSLKQFLFLHLFSGHRREGDLQQAVEGLGDCNVDVTALSVDVVISESFGNLLDPDTLSLFMRAIAAGWVAGGAAGPPCETWTVARERYLQDGYGPRPLRDVNNLAGFEVLKMHELKQVSIGNQLLGVSILLLLQAWLFGTFFMIEHPEEPTGERSASIWRLTIVRYLMGLPDIRRFRFLQGLFGAPSSKPTHLLFVRAPEDTEAIFFRCQTTTRVPSAVSIGRGEDGSFLTARLKVYPPAFCTAIAQCWWAHMLQRPCCTEPEQPDSQFLDAVRSMHSRLDPTKAQGHGPDFNPKVVSEFERN